MKKNMKKTTKKIAEPKDKIRNEANKFDEF